MDALLRAASKAAKDAGVIPEGKSDMESMAEEMGMDPETMNKQAQQIWSMLDEMSASDPSGYTKFIARQTEDAAIADKPHIFPKPGFSVKTTYKPPQEDLGVRVFVNVQAPMTSSGESVINAKGETIAGLPTNLSTAGLQIPLVVGEIRELKKEGKSSGAIEWVVDVIVHPWVLLKVTKDNVFKTSLTELAFTCVHEEVGMKLKKVKYKYLKGYKGLLASGRPAAYLLEVEKTRKKLRDKGVKPKPPRSTFAKEKAAKSRAEFNKKRKEMMKGVAVPPGAGPSAAAAAAAAGVGVGAGAGAGAAAGGAVPKPAGSVLESPMSLLKSIQASEGLGAQIREASSTRTPAAGAVESKDESKAESTASSKPAAAAGGATGAASAPATAPGKASRAPAPAAKPRGRPLIEEVLDVPEYSVKHGKDGEGTITVVVKLPGVEKFAGLDLDVAEKRFKLLAPERYELDIELPVKVDHAAARAKYSKKKQRLSVTLPVVA